MNETPLLSVERAVKTFTVRRRSLRRVRMLAVDDVTFQSIAGRRLAWLARAGRENQHWALYFAAYNTGSGKDTL